MIKYVHLSLITVMLGASLSWGNTNVIGFISTDTTWTQVGSPYTLMGKVIVKEGATLTIEPGVMVKVGSEHPLIIQGSLIAQGTETKPIAFTRKEEGWAEGAIEFEDSSTDAEFDDSNNYIRGSILQYCRIESGGGIRANSASPFIDHCVITNNQQVIHIDAEKLRIVISNNEITNNSSGIDVKGNRVIISQNTISENKSVGISAQGKTITLHGNTLNANNGGIYVEGSHTVKVTDNIVTNHSGSGVHVQANVIVIERNRVSGNDVSRATRHAKSRVWGDPRVSGSSVSGVGIYVQGESLTIRQNTLKNNTAEAGGISRPIGTGGSAYGAGLYIRGGTVLIEENIIMENKGSGGDGDVNRKYYKSSEGGDAYGGGIYVSSGGVVIRKNQIIRNEIQAGTGGPKGRPRGGLIREIVLPSNGSASGSGIYIGKDATAIIEKNLVIGNRNTSDISSNDKSTILYNIVRNDFVQEADGLYGGGRGGGIYGGEVKHNFFNCGSVGGRIIANNVLLCDSVNGSEITGNVINVSESGASVRASGKFTGNSITGNQAKFKLYVDKEKNGNFDATNNYWGVTKEVEIRTLVNDYFMNDSKAIADVVPFLTATPPPLGNLNVTISPASLSADDTSTAIVTAKVSEASGAPILNEEPIMAVIEGTGRISTVTNNANGTYMATYTASNQVGEATLLVAAPNNRLVKSSMITLTALTAGTKETATDSKDTTASTIGLNSRLLPWVIVLATFFIVAIIGVLIYQKRRKSST